MGHAIRTATRADAPSVRALLSDAKLPLDGVPDDLRHFLVAEHEGRVIGAIGLEPYGRTGLLRSAVVSGPVRGTGLGEALVRALLARAEADGVRTVVLLTTTAERWFPRFGFRLISRDEAPAEVKVSTEFRGACPDSAAVMRLDIGS